MFMQIPLKVGGKSGLIIFGKYNIKTYKMSKSIKVLEIQRQGKNPQNISEFSLGSKIKMGTKLNNA